MSDEYLDSELLVTGRGQARLLFDQKEYEDQPQLSEEWERGLALLHDPRQYGATLFSSTLVGNLLSGYRIALAQAQQREARLRLRLHVAATAPAALHGLRWE